MAKDMPERMSERYVRRYVIRKSVKRFVRKNVKRYVRKNVRRNVRKNVRRYVRQNVRKYVPSICAYIDLDNKISCLLQRNLVDGILFFCSIWHTAASTVGSTLFLCKEVSLVWQPWRRLWWNVLRRSSLGLPIGLPKELSMCGATS